MGRTKQVQRSKLERERDLLKTAELYLQGKTQCEIAGVLGVSQPTISKDLKELQKRWLEKSVKAIDERKAEELAKIDQLERTHWEAWVKSCEYRTMVTDVKGKKIKILVPQDQSNPMGDTKYLAGVQWCIDRRCKILGVDAPQKIDGKFETREYVVEFR
jgi:predicted transcriptional regulator